MPIAILRARYVAGLILTASVSGSCTEDPVAPRAREGQRVRWNVLLPQQLETTSRATPSLATSEYVILASSGRAISLDAATGALRWTLLDNTFDVAGLGQFFADGTDAVAVYPGQALRVNAATGAVQWRRTGMPAGARGYLSAAHREAFYGGSMGELGTAVDFATGAHRSFPLRLPGDSSLTTSASNVLVSGDTLYSTVYLESRANALVGELWLGRYDRATGRQLPFLRFPTDSTAPNATVTLAGDHIFLSDFDRHEVWSWNRFTGAARRIHKARGAGNLAPVMVSGDTLVIPSANLTLYVYEISTARLLFTVPTRSSMTAVAICGDVIYAQHSYIEAISRTTGRSLGVVLAPGTIRMSALTKGPGYVFGYTPWRAYALDCPP